MPRGPTAVLAGTESVELAMAQSNAAQLRMLASDLAGTREWAGQALALLDRLPDGPAARRGPGARAEQPRHRGARQTGDAEAGKRMLTESLDRARAARPARARRPGVLQPGRDRGRSSTGTRRPPRRSPTGIAYCRRARPRLLDALPAGLAVRAAAAPRRAAGRPRPAAAEDLLRHPDVAPISMIMPLTVLARARARTGGATGGSRWTGPPHWPPGPASCSGSGRSPATRCEVAWLAGDDAAARAAAERGAAAV